MIVEDFNDKWGGFFNRSNKGENPAPKDSNDKAIPNPPLASFGPFDSPNGYIEA